jgi:co-chaperonin GroES (HSP10)
MSKVKISQIRPVQAHILVRDMNFAEQMTQSGIYIPSDDGKSEGVKPRWCRVFAIGPEQTNVKVGDWIFVEHGRWTRGLEIEDEDGQKCVIHRVDENGIMMASDERPKGPEFGQFVSPEHGSVHSPSDFVRM